MLDSYTQHGTNECYRNKRQKTGYSTGTAPHKRAGFHVGLLGLTKSFYLSIISRKIAYCVAFKACFGQGIIFTCWPLTLTNDFKYLVTAAGCFFILLGWFSHCELSAPGGAITHALTQTLTESVDQANSKA